VSDNVVHAFGAAPPDQLQAEMLEQIDRLVDDIKGGQIVGVAFAAVCKDAGVSSAWTRGQQNHFALIGAVQRLNQRLLESGHDA